MADYNTTTITIYHFYLTPAFFVPDFRLVLEVRHQFVVSRQAPLQPASVRGRVFSRRSDELMLHPVEVPVLHTKTLCNKKIKK